MGGVAADLQRRVAERERQPRARAAAGWRNHEGQGDRGRQEGVQRPAQDERSDSERSDPAASDSGHASVGGNGGDPPALFNVSSTTDSDHSRHSDRVDAHYAECPLVSPGSAAGSRVYQPQRRAASPINIADYTFDGDEIPLAGYSIEDNSVVDYADLCFDGDEDFDEGCPSRTNASDSSGRDRDRTPTPSSRDRQPQISRDTTPGPYRRR